MRLSSGSALAQPQARPQGPPPSGASKPITAYFAPVLVAKGEGQQAAPAVTATGMKPQPAQQAVQGPRPLSRKPMFGLANPPAVRATVPVARTLWPATRLPLPSPPQPRTQLAGTQPSTAQNSTQPTRGPKRQAGRAAPKARSAAASDHQQQDDKAWVRQPDTVLCSPARRQEAWQYEESDIDMVPGTPSEVVGSRVGGDMVPETPLSTASMQASDGVIYRHAYRAPSTVR